jgi:SnoaL-like domain
MAKVLRSADCGNSPKNLLVESLAIAIETSNAAAFGRCVTADVVWTVPGRRSYSGKAACLAYLKARRSSVPRLVTVRRVVSHGRAGAADGVLNPKSGFPHNFCHMLEFANAQGVSVASISSYYSDLGDED